MEVKGRGTALNPSGRFEPLQLEVDAYVHDDPTVLEGEERPLPRTQFFVDSSRTALTRNNSPDVGFSASVNPYRGCEHGCIYCYARPTHEYLGLSAGFDFESKIFVKQDAPELLREKMMSKSWKPEAVNLSGVTDCYQPVERKLRITRGCLEVLGEFRNPFTIITKNHLVTRDIDVMKPMAEIKACAVFISVTTLDAKLAEVMEPRTSRPEFRLKAIEALAKAGIEVGVMVAPIVPGLTDHEMPTILEAVANAGAKHAGFVPLRLPYGLGELFEEWLVRNFPDRKDKVLNRVRELRGGKLNDPNFGSRMRGAGVFAEQLRSMFQLYTRKNGLNKTELELSIEHFKRPSPHGQLDLGI